MTFEDFDYVDVDYDSNTFTIVKEGHIYIYDINQEAILYSQVMRSGDVDKYEVYSQEEEYLTEEDMAREIDAEIKDLWARIERM